MKCAVTGSFDPITKGHIDIVKKASKMYDEVYVVVLNNETKTYMFDLKERELITKCSLDDIPNVRVFSYDGYVIDFCHEHNIKIVVRGFRNATDFEYETRMSKWNKNYGDIDTILLPQDNEEYRSVSSTEARDNMNNERELSKYLTLKTIKIIKEITNDGK